MFSDEPRRVDTETGGGVAEGLQLGARNQEVVPQGDL